MRRKRLCVVSIVVLVIALSAIFNPFYTLRVFTPVSCTISVQPTHFMLIRYSHGENLTGTQIVSEGYYTVCQSHPDDKAYGCYSTNCYGDNGTFVLTGQRYTLYDGTFYDDTEWESRANYFGVLVSDNVISGGAVVFVLPLIVLTLLMFGLVFGIVALWKGKQYSSPVTIEKTNDGKV